MLAERKIDEDYYNSWRARQKEASVSMNDREDKLGAIYEEIECDMELVGVTAIEDKLQDGVQHAISNLQMAGIKIWVLTGDKEGNIEGLFGVRGNISNEFLVFLRFFFKL